MTTLRERVSNELLPYVEKPGQYIGGEINQLVKPGDWERAHVRVAIGFPDAYTIGMSHLGCQILYWLCNHTRGVCAERVYSPWIDAEKIMRAKRIPLFTWDTRQPVRTADIFAISLQYEMGFTNVLNLLDLAGIPLRAAERDESHPIVIAGGPQADNPEPMWAFLDLVVLGDGEASLAAILDTVAEMKRLGATRHETIFEIARRYEWAYAPALYQVSYNADDTVRSVHPRAVGAVSDRDSSAGAVSDRDSSVGAVSDRDGGRGDRGADIAAGGQSFDGIAARGRSYDGIRPHIERCQTDDFNAAPFPVKPLVPFVEVVHDRISIEIMRGCPQRCRFCHAGYTKRPVRMRSVERILQIAEEAYWATGNDELGLLSLSTADYPDLPELAERANAQFRDRKVNISVPSMRVDKMLANIPWMVNSVRKSGLTLAVEAANDDMRAAIRKKVTDGNLIDGVVEAWKAGWRSVKLYYMAGFPGERPEDIDGIWRVSNDVSQSRRRVGKPPAAVNASVSWLVPKPYTPFQWAAQPRAEYFHEVRKRLSALSRSQRSAVKIKTHGVERSILEAALARGDRRLADVIETAWRNGARFDGWDETFNPKLWFDAFERCGLDYAWYAHRERRPDEVFPWVHLHGGAAESYLQHQYDDAFIKIGVARPTAAVVA